MRDERLQVMKQERLRILVLALDANPNYVTGQLIGYSHSAALARLHRVTLVVRSINAEAVRRANGGFHAIESIPESWLDRLYAWAFRHLFEEDRGNFLFVAMSFPQFIAFEWRAWRQLKRRIHDGEFDVVLRLLPIVPMMPSPFAYFLRKGPIPFVIGPINGGLPWPKGFSQLERQRASAGNWIAGLRNLYRYLPFAHSTFSKAAAIIAGSSNSCREFSRYREKVFYVPGENGVNSTWIQERPASRAENRKKLEVIMVNRLVSLKAVDLALRGAASLLRSGRARLSIVGDGTDRQRLEQLVDELGVRGAVTFCGWLGHQETLSRLRQSDVLLFPSLREFGGGVVFEALASGAVPVVADFGGPGDIVTDEVGFRIPLINEQRMPAQIETILERLASDWSHLETLGRQGQAYAREHLRRGASGTR